MRAPHPLSTSLDDLRPGDRAQVLEVCVPPALADWGDWLTTLGFEPGEPLQLLSRAMPGGDPLCVRVGASTYALRRAEAACIRVQWEASAERLPAGASTPTVADRATPITNGTAAQEAA